ncbi:hypothetical protein [Sutcliffiella deserti]|nr:hypothetical protein [Sutcliffiella deserti]
MVQIKKDQAMPLVEGLLLFEFSNGNRKFVAITRHIIGVLEKLKDPVFL